MRKGRKVVKVRFTVETFKDILDIVQAFAVKKALPSLPEEEIKEKEESEFYKKDIEFYREACEDAFTYEEMDAMLKLVSTKTPIKNKFSYFLAMINNDRNKQQ